MGDTSDVAARMQDRIKRTRRIIELAHNEEMIELLEEMIAEAEADIQRLEKATRSG
jgi:hypothetical protein